MRARQCIRSHAASSGSIKGFVDLQSHFDVQNWRSYPLIYNCTQATLKEKKKKRLSYGLFNMSRTCCYNGLGPESWPINKMHNTCDSKCSIWTTFLRYWNKLQPLNYFLTLYCSFLSNGLLLNMMDGLEKKLTKGVPQFGRPLNQMHMFTSPSILFI